MVTAGLTCAPLTWPSAATTATSTKPKLNAMASES